MAVIDGISSAATSTAASTYQVKQTPQVNSVEAVDSANAQSAGADIASQVVTVKEKNSSDNSDSQGKKQQENTEATNEQIKKAVDDLNKKMKNTSCEFGIHDKTNRVTIKIVDKETKDVIKEFPAEETLDMIAKAWELAGLMVDEKL
jgi:flagellar protein FlaG